MSQCSGPPRNDGTPQRVVRVSMDAKTAAAIAAAIKESDAKTLETTAEGVVTASEETLARRAYEKLQYDFPIVPVGELEALVSTMRREWKRGSGVSAVHPVTTMMVRACVEGASPRGDLGGTDEARQDDPTLCAFRDLCVALCVELPLRLLGAPDSDARRALELYTPDVSRDVADGLAMRDIVESLDEANAEDAEAKRSAHSENAPRIAEAEGSGDESDEWEPLESSSPMWFGAQTTSVGEDEMFKDMTDREVVDAKIAGLLGCLSPHRVGATCASKGPSAWDRSRVSESLLQLFETLCRSDADEQRYQLRAIPLRVLRERWAVAPGGATGLDAGLSRVLLALRFGETERENFDDERIALECLAYLCLRFGSETIGGCSMDFTSDGATSSTARSKLWFQVNKSLPVISGTLTRSLRVIDTQQHDPEWQDSVGLCGLLMTFYVQNTSSIALKDAGERVIRTSCLRTLVNVFNAVHASPFAEAIRRALVLTSLAYDSVREYVSKVPSVQTTFESDAFSLQGKFAVYGAIWRCALRSADADEHMSTFLSSLADALDTSSKIGELQDSMQLLYAAMHASNKAGVSLISRDGRAMQQLRALSAKVQECIISMVRERDARAQSKSLDKDGEVHPEKNSDAPEVEKRADALPHVSKILKACLADDDVVLRKAD